MRFKNRKEQFLWESAIKSYNVLLEGQNEDLAKNILTSANKQDSFDELVKADPTSNNKFLPIIAQFFVDGTDVAPLKYIFEKLPEIEKRMKLSPLRTKAGIVWNKDNTEPEIKAGVPLDFITFSEQVDALRNFLDKKSNLSSAGKSVPVSVEMSDGSDPNIIFNKNGIKIFEAYSQGACVKYSKGQSFCIGNASGGMYNTYRKSDASTFHFVFDTNMPYPLQVVVVDQTKNGLQLTDEKNQTKTIQNPNNLGKEDRGSYNNEYLSYLKSKGVNPAIFKHNPYTKEEQELNNIITNNTSLERFKQNIVGKTKKIPNGDIIDLTLEWLIYNGSGLDFKYWQEIISNPLTKAKKSDYEWRLATAGYYIKKEIIETFSKGNINKYITTKGEQGVDVDQDILLLTSPEIQLQYWNNYVIKNGERGGYIDDNVLSKVSSEIQQKYWKNWLKKKGYKSLDQYVITLGEKGSEIEDSFLQKVSPQIQQQYWDTYVIKKMQSGYSVYGGFLSKASPEAQQQYWVLWLKDGGVKSFDEYAITRGKGGHRIDDEILSKVSTQGQKQYWNEFVISRAKDGLSVEENDILKVSPQIQRQYFDIALGRKKINESVRQKNKMRRIIQEEIESFLKYI